MVTTQSQLPLATTRGPSENRKNRLSQVLGYPGETLTTHHGTHTHARSFRQRHGSSRLVSVSRQRVVQRRRSTGPLERKFIASSGSMLTKLCSRFQTASTLGGVCECVVFFFGGAPEPEPSVVSCGHPTVVVIGSSGGVLLLQSVVYRNNLWEAPELCKERQNR